MILFEFNLARRWVAIVSSFALGAVVTLTACSSSGASHNPPAIAASPARLTPAQSRDVPLAKYILSPQQAATIQNAIIIKAVPCARRFNVTMTLRPTNVAMSSDAVLLDNRYGVIAISTAQRYGYSKGEPASVAETDEMPRGSWNPPPREAEVLSGNDARGNKSRLVDQTGVAIHDGGCLGEATQELEGSRDYRADLIRLVNAGLSDSMNRLENDSRLLDAEHAWSDCMKSKGYQFAHRNEAASSVQKESASRQIATATADVTCAQQTNYLGIEHALDVAYQSRYVEEHSGELQTAYDGVTKALAAARVVVANGG